MNESLKRLLVLMSPWIGAGYGPMGEPPMLLLRFQRAYFVVQATAVG